MTHAITFIIFGGTGDLTKRKLVPAFATLLEQKEISKDSTLIGVGRTEFNDKTYKEYLLKSANSKKIKDLINSINIKYCQTDATKDLSDLKLKINETEKKSCSRIFYLATSFTLFDDIVKNLKKVDLHKNPKYFTRIVFEKPFGSDSKTCAKFEKAMHEIFDEDQIFRIDHYLGKETVQNLNTLKFDNPIIFSALNNKYVDKIDIVVDEDLRIGSRINYFNEFGIIKDMIQSHLLQVLSLLLMERPKSMNGNHIHSEKIKVLKALELKSAKEHLLGQYKSYSKELKNANLKDKKTETFARVKLNCKNKTWDGVDITLQTGKALKKKYGQIIVHFKEQGCQPNKLVVNIQPTQDIDMYLSLKKKNVCEEIKFNFCHTCRFGPNTFDGYEKMLVDVINNDHTLFATSKEIKASWKIVEKIEVMKSEIPFKIYKDLTMP